MARLWNISPVLLGVWGAFLCAAVGVTFMAYTLPPPSLSGHEAARSASAALGGDSGLSIRELSGPMGGGAVQGALYEGEEGGVSQGEGGPEGTASLGEWEGIMGSKRAVPAQLVEPLIPPSVGEWEDAGGSPRVGGIGLSQEESRYTDKGETENEPDRDKEKEYGKKEKQKAEKGEEGVQAEEAKEASAAIGAAEVFFATLHDRMKRWSKVDSPLATFESRIPINMDAPIVTLQKPRQQMVPVVATPRIEKIVDEEEIIVYADTSAEWPEESVMSPLQERVREAVEEGFGVVVLVYGHGNAYMNMAVALLKRLIVYYPHIRCEVVVDVERVEQRQQQLRVQGIDSHATAVPLHYPEEEVGHLSGHMLKPAAIMSSLFVAPLFLDTDIHPCPLSLGIIAQELLENRYTFMGEVAQARFHAVNGRAKLPLHELLATEEDRERWKHTPEINSGSVLFNKSDPVASAVLRLWAVECVWWEKEYSRMSEYIMPFSDQGALRIALFVLGDHLRRGFRVPRMQSQKIGFRNSAKALSLAANSISQQAHPVESESTEAPGHDESDDDEEIKYRMQCPVFLKEDTDICADPKCLFKHGSVYKYGMEVKWVLPEVLNSIQQVSAEKDAPRMWFSSRKPPERAEALKPLTVL